MDVLPQSMDTGRTATSPVDEERLRIRQELAEMSFDELQKLKESMGTKLYNKTMFNQSERANASFQRLNKNRPREVSAKFPVPRHREVVKVEKKVSRDPRFDDLSGTYDEKLFQQSYCFLNEIKTKEKDQLKKELAEEECPKRKKKIQKLLQRLNNQEREARRKKDQEDQKRAVRQELIDQLKEGRKPIYKKKSELRNMELAQQFTSLKKSKKLDKYLIKKRKKESRKHNPD